MEQLTVCASESPSLLATIPQHYLFVGWDRAILSVGIEYSFILGQKSYDKIFYVSNYSYFAVSLLCDWVWVRDYIFCCCCGEHELSPSCAVRGILSRVWRAAVWGRRIWA